MEGVGEGVKGAWKRVEGGGVGTGGGGGPARLVNCVFLAPLILSNVCRKSALFRPFQLL